MHSSRPTMRAWCQHCDATEVIRPEEIYSPEFNFWCPRCQSILILQDESGAHPPAIEPLPQGYVDPVTKVDREDAPADRLAPTKEDDDPPPLDVAVAEPEPVADAAEVEAPRRRTVSLDALDPYTKLAAELDAGITEDELSRPTRRLDPAAKREPPRTGSLSGSGTLRIASRTAEPLPRTRADTETPDAPANGRANGGKGETSVRELADLARNLDGPGPATSRTTKRSAPGPDARPAGPAGRSPADSGPIMARETVRVTRPAGTPANVKKEVEQRLSNAIAPALPPLPNWDGGDTQQVRELAKIGSTPPAPGSPLKAPAPPVDEDAPTPAPPGIEDAASDEALEAPEDDALEKLAVVEPKSGTTGLGSRTYERVDGPEGGEPRAEDQKDVAAAPPPAKAAPGEDLDWYALLDEALPEAEPSEQATEAARVVIRLPETMAPTSDADAEQVRQLQAKLEARGVGAADEDTDDEDSAAREDADHPAKRLDSKKMRALADDDDAGHSGAKDEETKDFAQASGRKDDDETRDNPGRPTREGVDPDAPTAAGDPERTAQLRAEIEAARSEAAETSRPEPRKTDSQKLPRVETARTPSERRGRGAPTKPGIVVEQFNRSDLDPGLVCARDSSSPEADYFKQLYQRIFHSQNGSSPRVVLVTSATKGEGKTTVAANLALVAARMPGRGALLIEADPRGGDLLRSFGLRMKSEGLLEALESGTDPSTFVLQFKLGMLDVLPLGLPGSDAAELISSDRIGEVVRALASRYPKSVVIIDGSSVLHAPDPLVLARYVDGVVLVVRADVTPREQVERARDLIGPEKVLGVVLNQAGS